MSFIECPECGFKIKRRNKQYNKSEKYYPSRKKRIIFKDEKIKEMNVEIEKLREENYKENIIDKMMAKKYNVSTSTVKSKKIKKLVNRKIDPEIIKKMNADIELLRKKYTLEEEVLESIIEKYKISLSTVNKYKTKRK